MAEVIPSWYRTGAIALVLLMTVAACGGTADTTTTGAGETTTTAAAATTTTAGPEPTVRPDLTIVVAAEPPNLSPGEVGHNEVNTPGMKNVLESLVDIDPEGAGALVPLLATSWEQVDDLRWRFQLREGVIFHDGSAFDADAAAEALTWLWSEDRVSGEGGGSQLIYGGPRQTFEVVDEFTLDVITEDPDPILPRRLRFFHIFSPQAAAERPETLVEGPVGTGPYKFVEWRRGQSIVLEANDDWWGVSDPEGGGDVNFASVTFEFRGEPTVRSAMMEAGEADLIQWPDPVDCAALDAALGTRCETAAAPNTIFIRFDAWNEDSIMRDVRVREAIALAIDMDLLLETIMEGVPVRAAQIVGPSVDGFVPDLVPYPYDPARARELLAEYQDDGGQLAPLTWAYQEGRFPRIDDFVLAAAAMVEAVGLEVQVLQQESSIFSAEFNPGLQPTNRIKLHTHGNALGDFSPSIGNYFREPREPGDAGCWCVDEEMFALIAGSTGMVGEARTDRMQAINRHLHEMFYMDYGGHLAFQYGVSEQIEWSPPPDHFFLVKKMRAR